MHKQITSVIEHLILNCYWIWPEFKPPSCYWTQGCASSWVLDRAGMGFGLGGEPGWWVGVGGGQGPRPAPAWELGKAPCSQTSTQLRRQAKDRFPHMHPTPHTCTQLRTHAPSSADMHPIPHTCKQPFPRHAPNSAYMHPVPHTCKQPFPKHAPNSAYTFI